MSLPRDLTDSHTPSDDNTTLKHSDLFADLATTPELADTLWGIGNDDAKHQLINTITQDIIETIKDHSNATELFKTLINKINVLLDNASNNRPEPTPAVSMPETTATETSNVEMISQAPVEPIETSTISHILLPDPHLLPVMNTFMAHIDFGKNFDKLFNAQISKCAHQIKNAFQNQNQDENKINTYFENMSQALQSHFKKQNSNTAESKAAEVISEFLQFLFSYVAYIVKARPMHMTWAFEYLLKHPGLLYITENNETANRELVLRIHAGTNSSILSLLLEKRFDTEFTKLLHQIRSKCGAKSPVLQDILQMKNRTHGYTLLHSAVKNGNIFCVNAVLGLAKMVFEPNTFTSYVNERANQITALELSKNPDITNLLITYGAITQIPHTASKRKLAETNETPAPANKTPRKTLYVTIPEDAPTTNITHNKKKKSVRFTDSIAYNAPSIDNEGNLNFNTATEIIFKESYTERENQLSFKQYQQRSTSQARDDKSPNTNLYTFDRGMFFEIVLPHAYDPIKKTKIVALGVEDVLINMELTKKTFRTENPLLYFYKGSTHIAEYLSSVLPNDVAVILVPSKPYDCLETDAASPLSINHLVQTLQQKTSNPLPIHSIHMLKNDSGREDSTNINKDKSIILDFLATSHNIAPSNILYIDHESNLFEAAQRKGYGTFSVNLGQNFTTKISEWLLHSRELSPAPFENTNQPYQSRFYSPPPPPGSVTPPVGTILENIWDDMPPLESDAPANNVVSNAQQNAEPLGYRLSTAKPLNFMELRHTFNKDIVELVNNIKNSIRNRQDETELNILFETLETALVKYFKKHGKDKEVIRAKEFISDLLQFLFPFTIFIVKSNQQQKEWVFNYLLKQPDLLYLSLYNSKKPTLIFRKHESNTSLLNLLIANQYVNEFFITLNSILQKLGTNSSAAKEILLMAKHNDKCTLLHQLAQSNNPMATESLLAIASAVFTPAEYQQYLKQEDSFGLSGLMLKSSNTLSGYSMHHFFQNTGTGEQTQQASSAVMTTTHRHQ